MTISIYPNFTASFVQFIDSNGGFLISGNGVFVAKIINSSPEVRYFYLVVTHLSSSTIVWSANRNTPISDSSELRFSTRGLTLYDDTGRPIWSTPEKLSSISSLQLLDSGNLVLVDVKNNVVWESFDYPTNIIVEGQRLLVGKRLVSSVSDEDLAEGSYTLVVGTSDAQLQWNEMNYWKFSMQTLASRYTNSFAVEYMMFNFTGVYLIGDNGKQVVISVILNNSDDAFNNSSYFRIAKLGQDGVVRIARIDSSSEKEYYKVPEDACRTPFICGRLGLCSNGGLCSCVPPFYVEFRGCMPKNGSSALPSPCNGSTDDLVTRYLTLSHDTDYFSNSFTDPVMLGVNLSACQNLCSSNCSCLGIFHSPSSGFCYMVSNYLGSMLNTSGSYVMDRIGYVKTIVMETSYADSEKKRLHFPILAIVMPSSIVMMISLVASIIWLKRRRGKYKTADSNLSRGDSGELGFATFPGLPVRFEYDELMVATEGFKAQLGSGGFGTVYKGLLQDGTEVAVKKITCSGTRGMREFLMEISAVGKIRHVNLIRMEGFCTHRGQRFLVYEYMNRGSLDRTLFGGEQVLKWNDRYEILLGTARGLAYLHTECDQKIIHCDIKPENILLHDKLQVKISDFGLSKLLDPKESAFFTTLRGTRGYIAPEWLIHSAISDKTDVYSYGMVLLEMIRGKRNSVQSRSSISSGETGHRLVYFPLYALEMYIERRYLELVDPRLTGQVAVDEVEKLVRVALCCLHEEPHMRPSMASVVGMLEGWMPIGNPRKECLSFLRRYDPNEQNELRSHRPPNIPNPNPYKSLSYVSSQQVSGPR